MESRRRRSWTSEEDQQLLEAIKLIEPNPSTPSNWLAISKHVPNRSNKDCRKRWLSIQNTASGMNKTAKGTWNVEEDERLRAGVKIHGTKWCKVAQMVTGRSSDQCAKRWKDILNPAIDHSKWSAEEDKQLIKAVQEFGRRWAKIVKQYFPARTGLSAKNRYNCLAHHFQPADVEEQFYSTISASPSIKFLDWSTSSSSSSSSSSSPTLPTSSAASAYLSSSGSDSEPLLIFIHELAKLPDARESPLALNTDLSGTMPSVQLNNVPQIPWLFSPTPQGIDTSPDACLLWDEFCSPLSVKDASSSYVLKLYGPPLGCSIASIAVVFYEKQIAYELLPLPKLMNEDAQPYIDDNGIIVDGCQNICRYLATRYPDQGAKLIPDSRDTQATVLFDQALFVETRNFECCAKNAFYETVSKRQQGHLPTELFTGSAAQELSDTLDRYESILSRQRYLVGNEVTLVDLYHLPYGQMLTNAGIDVFFSKGPNLSRWWADISSRPSWLLIRDGVPLKR